MKVLKISLSVGVLILAFGLTGLVVHGWRYSAVGRNRFFSKQNEAYYRTLASACDAAISQLPKGVSQKPNVPANDPSLPLPIRQLGADFVDISTERVYIGFGTGRVAFGIIWKQSELNPSDWELMSNADGVTKTVFSTSRPKP